MTTEDTLIIIIAFLCNCGIWFIVGYLFNKHLTEKRHKEISNKKSQQFDRLDLHYLTFGEKLN